MSGVEMQIDAGVATVILNRPDKHNGVNRDILHGVLGAAKQLRKNRTLRAVLLTGAGPSFCAGLDFADFTRDRWTMLRFFSQLWWPMENQFQAFATAWRDLPVPVVAVIQGSCFGAGMQLAAACDFRIAAPDAQLSVMEAKWGLIPDMSGALTLLDLVHPDVARRLIMTGEIVDAPQALEYGLVTQVSEEPVVAANALLEPILERSPDAIAAAKRLLDSTRGTRRRTTLALERKWQRKIIGKVNQRRAMRAAFAKARAEFGPRQL